MKFGGVNVTNNEVLYANLWTCYF